MGAAIATEEVGMARPDTTVTVRFWITQDRNKERQGATAVSHGCQL